MSQINSKQKYLIILYQYDKKNRENIENKSKTDSLQFDNEMLENRLNVINNKFRILKVKTIQEIRNLFPQLRVK